MNRKMSVALVLALALVLVAGVLAGCGGPGGGGGADTGGGADADKQVVVGISSEPTSLDEAQISDYNSDRVANEIYDTLLRFADGSMDVEPALAESYEISEDGLTYTLHLRQGVTFHDGTDFNADAVLFNYERMTDPKHEAYAFGEYPYAETIFGEVEKVEAPDANTVVFTLKETFAPFLNHLAMTQFGIASPEAVRLSGKDYTSKPVGTGPFKFVSWTPGTEVVLEKNEDYWAGPAKINTVIYRFIKDNNVRLSELEAGTVDFVVDMLPDEIARLKEDSSLQVDTLPGQHTWYLEMNCQRKPFDKKEVRQAFSYAINKQAIVDGILKESGELAKSFLPPSTPYYTEDVAQYDYNPDKAKELLAAAGYAKGLEVDFYIPESGSGMQQPDAMATAIQSDLKAVGVTLNIQKMEWGAYLDMLIQPEKKQKALISEMSWVSDNGDADNFLYTLCGGMSWPTDGFNMAFYKNAEFDKLVKEARTTMDTDKRGELYEQAQKILAEDAPYVPVDHENQIVVYRNTLEGFQLHPRGFFRFYPADVVAAK
jgi:peptide/nickel transport system substrate-binding protein